MKKSVKYIIYLAVCALLVVLDQITKNLAVTALKGKDNAVWIKNVFELEYCENTGAAFSSFTGKQGFLLAITSIVLVLILVEFVRIPEGKRYAALRIDFLLIVAGAIGNMIDRVKQGYVVDFFYFVPVNFPRFNVADIYVTVAMAMLVILLFIVYKDNETEFLFKFKKK